MKTKFIPTAEVVTTHDYPYGRLKCTLTCKVEFSKTHGFRIVTQTINPKTGRLNAPKKSTYYKILLRFIDEKGRFNSTVRGLNGAKEINAAAKFCFEHFDLFTQEELKYLYISFIEALRIDMYATQVYNGATKESLTPLYKHQIETAIFGLDLLGNFFNQLQLNIEAISACEPENFNPFR